MTAALVMRAWVICGFKLSIRPVLKRAKAARWKRARMQTEAAIEEADMVLMLTDARVGILPEDELFARLLRMGRCAGHAGRQ